MGIRTGLEGLASCGGWIRPSIMGGSLGNPSRDDCDWPSRSSAATSLLISIGSDGYRPSSSSGDGSEVRRVDLSADSSCPAETLGLAPVPVRRLVLLPLLLLVLLLLLALESSSPDLKSPRPVAALSF